MVVQISECNGSGDWLSTAPTEVAGGDGRTMCETDEGTFVIQFDFYILGYILKGGETQLSKLHILTKFDIIVKLLNFESSEIISGSEKVAKLQN